MIKTIKTAFGLLMFLGMLVPSGLSAQTIDENITSTATSSSRIATERAAYIMINSDYPLVPGDTFQLTYSQRGENKSFQFFVEEDYTVNLTYMGKLNVEGMTFADLRIKVEELVRSSFPGSFAQLIIQSPGVFMIPVLGEVTAAIAVPAWGYMKLSSAIEEIVTDYSSYRNVEIISADGESKFYDLYQAGRFGDQENNPFLKLGDTIVLHKHERMVSIEGEVRRPGIYELLEGEDLLYLLETQADGFTPLADTSKVQITRMVSDSSTYGETIYLDLSREIPENFQLNNMDLITVPLKAVFQPKVIFQGAIGTTEAGMTISNKIPQPITPGEKLSTVLLRVQEEFNLGSDLAKALLTRNKGEEVIPVNLEELLLNPNPETDIVLLDKDVIVIPFRQYQVYVGGQVTNPGSFPYIPNRTWEYYIGLAGGFKVDSHMGTRVRITDVYGDKHKKDERYIQPEDVIYAPANHPFYWIGQYGSDIAVLATSITTTILLINWVGDMMSDVYEHLPYPEDTEKQ